MADQTYDPYRTFLLSKSELSALIELRPFRAFRDIAVLWLQIVIAWSVAALVSEWWCTGVALVVIGNRYYSLFIIGHDGLHRRLHRRREVNDLINDVLILGPICAITRVNRGNHMVHHGSLALPEDPDAYKYANRHDRGPVAFIVSLTALPFVVRAVRNVFGRRRRASAPPRESYSARDLAIVTAWQVSLLIGLTYAFGWWGYFVMWWIPVYAFTFCMDLLRVFCEHSTSIDTVSAGLAERLVSFSASRFELTIFAPMNMNNHIAHHLWPSIPYYNLPRASETLEVRMRTLDSSIPRLVIRGSYIRHLVTCLVRSVAGGRQ